MNNILLSDMYGDYYRVFSEIRRAKIDPKQIMADYGQYAPFVMNYTCPITVRRGGAPLDELAKDLNFDSADDLYQYIMSYVPKRERTADIEEELSRHCL